MAVTCFFMTDKNSFPDYHPYLRGVNDSSTKIDLLVALIEWNIGQRHRDSQNLDQALLASLGKDELLRFLAANRAPSLSEYLGYPKVETSPTKTFEFLAKLTGVASLDAEDYESSNEYEPSPREKFIAMISALYIASLERKAPPRDISSIEHSMENSSMPEDLKEWCINKGRELEENGTAFLAHQWAENLGDRGIARQYILDCFPNADPYQIMQDLEDSFPCFYNDLLLFDPIAPVPGSDHSPGLA